MKVLSIRKCLIVGTRSVRRASGLLETAIAVSSIPSPTPERKLCKRKSEDCELGRSVRQGSYFIYRVLFHLLRYQERFDKQMTNFLLSADTCFDW
jgi:hypothetical protein